MGGSKFMAVEGGQNAKHPTPTGSPETAGRGEVQRVSSVRQLKRSLKALPAWLLSLVFHFLALMILTLATFATAPPTDIPKSFDVSPFDTKVAPEEVVHMMTDPSDDPVRTLASAAVAGDLSKTEKPSATPALSEQH